MKSNEITEITKQVKLVCGYRLTDSLTLKGCIDNLYFRKVLKAEKLYGSLSLAGVQIKTSDNEAKIKRMEGSTLREISVNLIVIGQGH